MQTSLKALRIAALAIGSLIGKLSFSQTRLFGKFARTHPRPLNRKLYRRFYAAKLSPRESTTLKRRIAALTKIKPRIARGIDRYTDFILLTDAAKHTPLIAGFLFRPRTKRVLQITTGRAPSSWMRLSQRRNTIFGSELLAPIAFI